MENMERKKIGQIQKRISMRRLVCNHTVKCIIINMHTKYDSSSLHSFTVISDENFHHSKYGKKENQTNTVKNKQEKAGSQSRDTIYHYQPAYKIWLLYHAQFHRNLDENFQFHHSKYGKKESWTNTRMNTHKKAGSQFHGTIHHYQPAHTILLQLLYSFTELYDEIFHYLKYGKKEN